jgi:hypothetical protein
MGKVYVRSKMVRSEGLVLNRECNKSGKYARNFIKYFLNLGFYTHFICCILSCLVCMVVYCLVYLVVVVLGVLLMCCTMGLLLLSYVYLLYYVRIAIVTLDAGLLARIQCSEGPANGHLDTEFSWFPCV